MRATVSACASVVRTMEAAGAGDGKPMEAEPLAREALAGRKRVLGAAHPDTLASLNNLANLLKQQGKLTEAESLYQ